MQNIINLSVHQLVDFLLRTGDIDNRVFNKTTMNEGSRIHSSYQSSQRNDYLPEYQLKHSFNIDEYCIVLEGRADGIIKNGNKYIIEEIKTTVIDLSIFKTNNYDWHLGQAKCYAFMFAFDKKLFDIDIQLTYIRQGKEKEKVIDINNFSMQELEIFVTDLLREYLSFYNIIVRAERQRKISCEEISFPFETYRPGQREIAKYTYLLCEKGGRLFIEAPTGIGKTMSVLFPCIKFLSKDEKSKIFYLTAKSSGKELAFNAIEILKNNGLIIKDISVTAKDKICPNTKRVCNPDECLFAKGYYNKIQRVLRYSLINYSSFNNDIISKIANEYKICPFEFQLDLSLFCDVIICDYNYLFDPISYMKRYFDEDASHYIALIDEAHNLVDRSRDMYSSSIQEITLHTAQKSVKGCKNRKIKNHLLNIKELFENNRFDSEDENLIIDEFKEDFIDKLKKFTDFYIRLSTEEYQDVTKELTDLYLEINRFLKIFELKNDKYACFITKNNNLISFNLNCLDASSFINSKCNQVKASTFFSATFSPIKYYVDILGGKSDEDPQLLLPSPFSHKNLKVLIASNVSVKYKNRDLSLEKVADYIKAFVSNKIGNYFIYSPSYEYMEKILLNYKQDDEIIYFQSKKMTEKDKIAFLNNFSSSPKKTTLGFIVLGGSFGEGIDLVNDRLIGAVIIGIGIPKINFQSDLIKDYYNKQGKSGYDYAYYYPGLNKVQQAGGRVIRSENDRGAILLIDDRYFYKQYRSLFFNEWKNYQIVYNSSDIKNTISKFFNK